MRVLSCLYGTVGRRWPGGTVNGFVWRQLELLAAQFQLSLAMGCNAHAIRVRPLRRDGESEDSLMHHLDNSTRTLCCPGPPP